MIGNKVLPGKSRMENKVGDFRNVTLRFDGPVRPAFPFMVSRWYLLETAIIYLPIIMRTLKP